MAECICIIFFLFALGKLKILSLRRNRTYVFLIWFLTHRLYQTGECCRNTFFVNVIKLETPHSFSSTLTLHNLHAKTAPEKYRFFCISQGKNSNYYKRLCVHKFTFAHDLCDTAHTTGKRQVMQTTNHSIED